MKKKILFLGVMFFMCASTSVMKAETDETQATQSCVTLRACGNSMHTCTGGLSLEERVDFVHDMWMWLCEQ